MLIGRALGDFIVRDQIGEGGFGVVYRAEQPMLGREAVIKVSSAESSPEFVARFLREARLASKLDHPYAAHIYAFGSEQDGTLWTAMELVRGTPLDQLLKNQGPLRLERFLPLFDKLCEVVHTAHEQGIIHRDLKPANVMVLSRAGRLLPKLLDLGIAKGEDAAVSDDTPTLAEGEVVPPASDLRSTQSHASASVRHTRAGRHLGSPAYMAPEQWVDARKADARTDVYALGILAFEVLTGNLPFAGGTVVQIARQHARASVPPLGDGFPPALDAVIAKAMAKKAADRYATALELASAMREASGLEVEAVKLPELDPFLREELLANAPQPLAEAVAALDGVRNAHQMQGALFGIVRVVARMLGNLALACWRVEIGIREPAAPSPSMPADVETAMRALRRHGLADGEWLDLARAITATVPAEKREMFALPELVDLFRATGDVAPLAEEISALIASKEWFDAHLGANQDAMLAQLAVAMPRLEKMLRGLAWLDAYTLAVSRGQFAERWMGVRRPHRAVTPVRAVAVDDELVLLDADGTVALSLGPFFQVAPPAPGHATEVFVFDGANRDGARMVSLPTGFERTDEELWTWLREHTGIDADEREQAAEQKPPYRGLATFTREDASQFVGREQETEAFANRLKITPLLVVVGASGAGKSSFVQAGVVPSLGSGWTTVIVRPGGSPIGTLAATLAASEIAVPAKLEGDALGVALRAWTERENTSVLVYIDQFEELFTLCQDPAERERYAQLLVRAARSAEDRIRVVLTVRDDFLLRCQQVEALRERLVQGLQLLATPTDADLMRILNEPARRTGYQFEDLELPAEMVAAVADMPAALPLLSFTASQMWELRDRHHHRLTRKAYETLGGVGGALAQHAERVFGQMSFEEQRLVRVAFRNLVTADGTRAVLTRAELLQLLGEQTTAESVLEKLITARLLTASEGVGGVDRVEVVHEALLSAWPRLIEWRREDAEGARLRDQLRAAARQWSERGRPRGLLWRDEALTEYQLWRARHGGALIPVELAFGEASEREAVRGRRLRRAVVGTIVAILVVGMVVALVLYRDAESQRVKAATNEKRAVTNEARANDLVISGLLTSGQRSASGGDLTNALVYLTAAKRGGANGPTLDIPLAQVRRALNTEVASWRGHEGKILALAVSSDRKHFATTGADNAVSYWAFDKQEPIHRFTDAPQLQMGLAISPDMHWLATGSVDQRVRVWDLLTGTLAYTWNVGDNTVHNIFFSPDSKRVVAFHEERGIGVWGLADGKRVLSLEGEGNTVGLGAQSPDGNFLALPNYDGYTRVYDVRTGVLAYQVGPSGAVSWAARFSPDGKLLAVDSWDNIVRLYDTTTHREIAKLIGHSGNPDTLTWSPDGQRLATGGRDATVRVWDRQGKLLATLDCRKGTVRDIGWNEHQTQLVVACGDVVAVFDIASKSLVYRTQTRSPEAWFARFIPGSGDVITGEADGSLRRITPVTSTTYPADHPEAPISRLDICDSARSFVTMSEDGIARRWSSESAMTWKQEGVTDVVCDRAGTVMFYAKADGSLWKLDGVEPHQIKLSAPLGPMSLLSLSPNGAHLAIVDEKLAARMLDVATEAEHVGSGTPTVTRTWEPKLVWSSDGTTFIVCSDGGAVAYDGATANHKFDIAPPGNLLRRIAVDVASDTIFASAISSGVYRFRLRDGKELPRLAATASAWALQVVGDKLYAGFDNATVVEYETTSGEQVRSLGSFGSDIYALADAGDGLLWVGSGARRISLVDLATRAVLAQQELATEPWFLRVVNGRSVVSGNLSGLMFASKVAGEFASLDRLELEVRCRTALTLENGALVPRAPDPAACAELRSAPQ